MCNDALVVFGLLILVFKFNSTWNLFFSLSHDVCRLSCSLLLSVGNSNNSIVPSRVLSSRLKSIPVSLFIWVMANVAISALNILSMSNIFPLFVIIIDALKAEAVP